MACPSLAATHALTLMKQLNSQRKKGQLCDCVIRLQINPGRLYLAHKNILAASSPVLSSLLTSQGTLLDLEFPNITSETLGHLLEFIYTGTLPPPGWDDSVRTAASYLEMEELQQALSVRMMALYGSTSTLPTDEAELNGKRQFVETQQTEHNQQSASHHNDRKRTSPLLSSCELVPVIHHVSATGSQERLSTLPNTHWKSANIGFSHHAIREEEAEDTKQEFGTYQYGHHPKHQGVFNIQMNKADLFGSETKQNKCNSANRDEKNVSTCYTPKETLLHLQETTKEFDDKNLGLHNCCESVVRNSTQTAEVPNGCSHTPQAATEDPVVKDRTVENNRGHSERDLIHSACGTTHLNFDNHSGFRIGNLTMINHFDLDNRTGGTIYLPTVVHMGKSHTDSLSAKSTNRDGSDTFGDRKSELFDEHVVGGHAGAQSLWNSEENFDVCLQVNDVNCPSETEAPELWNENCNICTDSAGIDNDKITDTSINSTFVPQSKENLMTPKTNNIKQEKRDFTSQRKDQSPVYHGSVIYHFLKEGYPIMETREHVADVCTSVTGTHIREGSHLHIKSALSPPFHEVVTVEPKPTDHGGPIETQRRLSDSSEQSAGGPGAVQPYQCTMCERAFSQRGSLNRHVRSHLGVRPYTCPHCPMTFSRQYRVTEHLRIHQRSSEGLERMGPV